MEFVEFLTEVYMEVIGWFDAMIPIVEIGMEG